jgi:hypothetical protein
MPDDPLGEVAEPLDGAVEIDWQRPLDEWEEAFKDELFLWTPFFLGLGHAHLRLDANAKYALARIAGVMHRQAIQAVCPHPRGVTNRDGTVTCEVCKAVYPDDLPKGL